MVLTRRMSNLARHVLTIVKSLLRIFECLSLFAIAFTIQKKRMPNWIVMCWEKSGYVEESLGDGLSPLMFS